MNNVVAVSQSPLTPAGGGKLPAVVLPPGATQVLMVQPGGGSPAGAAYSPMAATAGVYPQLSPQQPPAVMWGQESMPIPSHQPEDVVMQVNRDLNGAEMGKIEQAGIEKPMTLCACVPGFSAHERERCAHYDHWPTVWAGHHASFLSGYPLLAFRMIFNLIPQFIICIMVIVDKAWVDKQFETKGIIVTDPQQKKAQEQYLFFLSNWTNMVQFFFFLHATFVTYVAIQKYSANNTGPVPCPWWVKVCWQTHSMILQATVIVTLLYWILLAGPPHMAISIAQHGVNTLLQLVDFIVVGTLVPFVHSIWVLLFAICFILFSVIHWGAGATDWAGNNYIYGVLDWNDPEAAGTLTALVLIFVPAIFGLVFSALSIARIRAFTKVKIPY
mmetsp:Transcript_36022/g.84308  ORF Transcript_36022/g.84308 Transcript_36022/m.84308 type:complete len:385 (-) Transcript_36022:421-1575(-)